MKKIIRKLNTFLAIHRPSEGLLGEERFRGGRERSSVLNPVSLIGPWDNHTEVSGPVK